MRVIYHKVKDGKQWTFKASMDSLHKGFAPFATEIVTYVVADGSNQVAKAANDHDMEGLIAFSQTPEAAGSMEVGGVIPPYIMHIESSHE